MNGRTLSAHGAFVIWTAITMIGGHLRSDGTPEPAEPITPVINPVYVSPAAVPHPVAGRQTWRDPGLDHAPRMPILRLLWLPCFCILAFVSVPAYPGLPSATVVLFVLIKPFSSCPMRCARWLMRHANRTRACPLDCGPSGREPVFRRVTARPVSQRPVQGTH